ncbi:MAG TPA: hypothetical protein VNV86_13845 [Candidatus Acidoferrum sp.]|nr:hypothetical protein [Candidatus Acidoferrum sp.]
MMKMFKQARAALSLLSADEVRARAETPVHFGLVADSSGAYAEMEEFLVPHHLPRAERMLRIGQVYRANDAEPPAKVDVVLYEPGLACPDGAYTFRRGNAEETVREILLDKKDLELALARQYPAFRRAVVEGIVHEVARENAVFAVATALPNIIPNLIELPWLFGEFASDTAFLTANQMRMAFQIAAACGKDVGFSEQKLEMLGIAGGAFGWRALARELVGHIPLGGGLIPKGAIAYAGTYLAGKGLEKLHSENGRHTSEELKSLYARGLERGRQVVRELRAG